MRVTTDLAAGATGLVSGLAPAKTSGASFAAKLAGAMEPTSTPKAETTRKVPGHSYEEIVSGPRNGMFINRSGNARDGEAFTIVKRKDHELHVYGTGKDREVVVAPREGQRKETTKPVEGHPAYVEVTAGPRNGMFINMTDNARRGQAFVLVKKDDHDLHIYGTGEHRRVIVSWHSDQKDQAGKPDTTDTTDAPATGGAAAEL